MIASRRSSRSGGTDTELLIEDHPTSSPPTSTSTTPTTMPSGSDFALIKVIARLTLQVIRKFWAFVSAGTFAVILFYWLYGGLVATGLVFAALTGLVYHSTDRFLYHPDQPATARVFVPSPSMLGMTFENVYVRSKDATRLHMFLVRQPDESAASAAPTVLYFHGNAGNIGHRLLNVKGIVQALGCNVCLLEYRGYGHSDGSPSEEGIYLDAQSALDYIAGRPDIDPAKIIVFGRSLGGAVAIDLCSRAENSSKVSCLVVENTFTSIPEVARALFNVKLVRWLPKWFYKNQFLSRVKVARLTMPVLYMSGTGDQLIPPKMMTDLYHATGAGGKKLAKFIGGTHNETWQCSLYYQTFEYFIKEVVQITAGERYNGPPPPTLVNPGMAVV